MLLLLWCLVMALQLRNENEKEIADLENELRIGKRRNV